MKTEKQENDLQPISIGHAQELVGKYFKNVNTTKIEIKYPVFGKMQVEVMYEDFKPAQIVRRELEDMIPISEVKVTRDYSDKEGQKAFNAAWHDYEYWQLMVGGKKTDVSLRGLIYDYLADKTL